MMKVMGEHTSGELVEFARLEVVCLGSEVWKWVAL